MNYSVVKGTSYILVNTPDMIIHNGTTQTMEKMANPNSEYIKAIGSHIRTYEQVLNYAPSQVYIGNMKPEELETLEMPWYDKDVSIRERFGKFGEIMPQDEFIGLMKLSDSFDLVMLEMHFSESVKDKIANHPLFGVEYASKMKEGFDIVAIQKEVEEHHGEGIYNDGKLVGCVKKAHDSDVNLTAHIMFENIVSKASGVLAFKHLIHNVEIGIEEIDYVIECSEEACGDMNQRGGGNFAKAIAEIAGAVNSTGSDIRGFCAAPTHALIQASALVQAGVYKNVAIVAGGATAKLGMNGKDHVKKGMPVLEDVIGGFGILVSENDGISPIIRNDLVGKHNVGTGSSPQAVITALITMPLDKGNMKITDVDKYSVEMQNPDVTKPAGAGDVPLSNYKMIGALAVKRGEMDKNDLMSFVKKHGMQGWAPTQGHIPSGVPYVGFAREELMAGNIKRAMIVGKGSLFLARMTNLFDGVSVILEQNSKTDETATVSKQEIKKLIAEAMREFGSNLVKE
ncbi:MAG: glycine/sarcosine/betaine reductase complex component C subunit beta [Eubacteriales bacterium]|nr:glycine/sarcosine/betaine reductase complex component C subunit beta [Eubacteriales bacterium]